MTTEPRTLAGLAPLWISSRSYATASRRLREIQCRAFIDVVGDLPPDQVGLADVMVWWASLEGLAPASRRSAWMAMRGFFRWMNAVGFTTSNPIEAIRPPAEPDHAPRAVTKDELGRLWRAIEDDDELRLVVALAAGAGLRRSEIAALRCDDLDRSTHPWLLTVMRKGGRRQIVPVDSAWLHAELASIPKGSAAPMVSLSLDQLTNRVRRVMLACGIRKSLHSLRHYYAQDALAKHDVAVVQARLGHRSLETTGRYLVR